MPEAMMWTIMLTIALFIALALLVGFIYAVFLLINWVKTSIGQRKEGRMGPDLHKDAPDDKSNYSRYIKSPFDSQSITARFIVIGLIALAMLIPVDQIGSLIDERKTLYHEVLDGIAGQWGPAQVISGPALIIPVVEKYQKEKTIKKSDGSEQITYFDARRDRHVVVLPKELNDRIRMDWEYRFRSIYRSLIYSADIDVEGVFDIPDFSKLSDDLVKIRYDKAFIVMGLKSTKAITDISPYHFDGRDLDFSPGTKIQGIYLIGDRSFKNSGFHVDVPISRKKKSYGFNFHFVANGSEGIRFTAFGEKTHIALTSSWLHPSFQGDVLPAHKEISNAGFSAAWEIPSLSRPFPQSWILEDRNYNLGTLMTGVDLFEPVSLYSTITKSVKYAILFIVLTFLTFLIFEIANNTKLHLVQYILIGLSLAIFYLMLLSLSEHMRFQFAYVIASMITIASISVYAYFCSNKLFRPTLVVFVMLLALYAILYSLLRLEDYALLFGTGLLLAVLLVLMWITRNLQKMVQPRSTSKQKPAEDSVV